MSHLPAVTFPAGLDVERIAAILCNVYDSGYCNYFAKRGVTELPEGWDWESGEGLPDWCDEPYTARYFGPMFGGRTLFFNPEIDKAEPDWILDAAAIQRGLDCFATVAPRHFADTVAENHDAITGEVFLQLCLFGEIRYS